MAWTTPATFTASNVLTAAQLNANVRDNTLALYGTMTSFTPTISQGASSNISKTVANAKYIQQGPLCHFWVDLTMTAAGTAGSAVVMTLPLTAVGLAAPDQFGSVMYYQTTGTIRNQGVLEMTSTTAVQFSISGANTGLIGLGLVGGNVAAVTVASGDIIRAYGCYPVA